MPGKPPYREQTDESLRTEREQTDRHLEDKRARIEEDSDAVRQKAQDRADDVLETARARADSNGAGPSGALRRERRAEDRALEEEREVEAALLESEREARRRVLAELLRSERTLTDEDLLREREGSDAALLTRDDFLAMASHDLRGLLGAIVLSTSLILKEVPPVTDARSRKLKERVEGIGRFTGRMNRLLSDLLDVVSIEAGRLDISAKPTDVKGLVQEAVEPFLHVATARGIALTLDAPEDLPQVDLDAGRILQVLTNLLSNAVKFTRGPGRIELALAARDDGRTLAFSVRDSGPGIPRAQQQTIFERFRQSDPHDRRGHGLGLHISKNIVEAHGGQLRVDSVPGQGSTFTVRLPLERSGG